MIIKIFTETKEVELKNAPEAKFTIGMVDEDTFRRLQAKLIFAKNLLLGEKAFDGENLKQLADKMEEKTLIADEKLMDVLTDFVAQGVRGHSGIKTKDGTEISFETDDAGLVSKKIITLYRQNRLIIPLALDVMNFNSLSEDERKN